MVLAIDQPSGATLASRLAGHQFCCLGAAHMDHVLTLAAPMMLGRTNPVNADMAPGGVGLNIAATLGRLKLDTSLCCAPAPPAAATELRKLGVALHNLDAPGHDCRYIAVLSSDGEVEMGLAAMEAYDRIGVGQLPAEFPFCRAGTVIIDAAFKPALIRKAAKAARRAGCMLVGAGTSPAKVRKLDGVKWDLLLLNEAEAAALIGDAHPEQMAIKLAVRTGGAVAVTCGSQGAILAIDDRLLRQVPPPFSAVNDNGAGDTFAATLAAALAAQLEPAVALRLATAAGAAAVAHPAWRLRGQRPKGKRKPFASALAHFYQHTPQGMHLQRGAWQTIPQEEYQHERWLSSAGRRKTAPATH